MTGHVSCNCGLMLSCREGIRLAVRANLKGSQPVVSNCEPASTHQVPGMRGALFAGAGLEQHLGRAGRATAAAAPLWGIPLAGPLQVGDSKSGSYASTLIRAHGCRLAALYTAKKMLCWWGTVSKYLKGLADREVK